MALVNGGFLIYRDMKKFLKNLLLQNCWSDFEIISQECYLGDPFQKLFAKFRSLHKHGSVEWGFSHYRDMKVFFSETASQILKKFHRNVPWVTLFKNCSQNFYLCINMALVNGGFLHYLDMKKFLKNCFLQNHLSDFEIFSQECSLGDPFQKLFAKF